MSNHNEKTKQSLLRCLILSEQPKEINFTFFWDKEKLGLDHLYSFLILSEWQELSIIFFHSYY